MPTELATAYLSLVPTLKGAQGNIASELTGSVAPAAAAAGKAAGSSLSSAMGGAFSKAASGDIVGAVSALGGAITKALPAAVIVGGITAGFAGLYKVGGIFDDVTDTIRIGTGAQGAALEGLAQVAKNVATSVPTSFEAAGQTVADLNTRLGLTGETLTTVGAQYLEAGRMLGETVDINTTSAAFSAFQIQGDAVSGAMDQLFQVSQATGVGINDLASGVQNVAPALQNMGFSFGDSISLLGTLDKAGLNSQAVLNSMSKGMVTLAKDGEQPQEAFRRVTGEIQQFVDAGDTAGALDLASKVFGTKGASQFVGALQSGVVNLNDLQAATGATGDTILGVASETADFAESWQIVKNNALAALEPIGTAAFNMMGSVGRVLADASEGIGPALSAIGASIAPVFAAIGPVFAQIGSAVGPLIPQLLSLWQSISPVSIIFQALLPVLPQLAGVLGQLASTLGGVLTGVLSTLLDALTPVVTMLVGTLSGVMVQLMPIVASLAATLGGVLGSVLTALSPLLALIATVIGQVLQAVLPLIDPILALAMAFLPLLEPIVQLVGALLTPLIGLLTALLTPILGLIQPLLGLLIPTLQFLIAIFAAVVTAVVNVITWFVALIGGSADAQAQWNTIWAAVGKFFTDLWNGIVSWVSGVWSGFIGWITGVINGFAGWWNGIWSGVMSFINGIWTGIVSFATGAWNGFMGFIEGIPGRIMGFFSGIGSWLVGAGQDLIQGFIDGIKGMLGSVGDAIGGVMDFVGGFFPHSPAERGPFSGSGWTQLKRSGQAIGDQFAAGFDTIDVLPLAFGSMPAATSAAAAHGVSAGSGGAGGSGTSVVVNGNVGWDPDEVARELDTRAQRAQRRAGVNRVGVG